MRFDLAFLVRFPMVLPDCTWEAFCQDVGIERADMGKAFLDALGGKVRSNGEAGLPECIRGLAVLQGRDPYILWVWTLSPEFRLEPPGVPMRLHPHVAENHYLLRAMRDECKGAGRDWAQMAEERMVDREHFVERQTRIAVGLGFDGIVEELHVFPD